MFGWIYSLFGRKKSRLVKRVPELFRYLPTSLIEDSPDNARVEVNVAYYEGLKQSVERYGILVPVIVYPKGEAYRLIAGHRRLRAARELNLESVPSILRRVSERRAAELALVENTFRLDLTRLETLRAFNHAVETHPNVDKTALAKILGLDPEAMEGAAALLGLSEGLQRALDRGEVGEPQAFSIQDIGDDATREELVDLVRERNLNVEETQALVDRILHRQPRFVTSDRSVHYHTPACAYAQLIPEPARKGVYSRAEGKRWGKIACMNCL